MRATTQKRIRELLRANPDGLSQKEISKILGISITKICRSLLSIPDVYIDRWQQLPGGQFQKVLMAAHVPEDCPHPIDAYLKDWHGPK